MKILLKVLKWIGLSIGLLLVLIVLSGLVFRLFGPEAHQAMGKLVDIGGFKLHINSTGEKSDKPTLVIEAGMGLPGDHYHWLSEGLKDSMRVVRYDRAGLGYSELSNTPRDLETVARELHTLLERAGESPPYILVAHSFGGPYMRVFTQLYPAEVAAMVLIDCTHPEQVERFDLPLASSFIYKVMIGSYDIQAILGDLGILGLYDRLKGPILAGEGLPNDINTRMLDFSLDGKYVRGYIKEMKNYHAGLKRAGETRDFGTLPIRVFTTTETPRAYYIAKGIDPDQRLAKKIAVQKEFTDLSTNGKQILIDANHNSIYTKKENADIICKEIIQLLGE